MRSFFFYDLETSGLSARHDRIMQFAGRRTTPELEFCGDPVNVLIRLTDDILPSPQAILTTGITPQSTQQDGISEVEFCNMFLEQIATPETVMIGYNNVRFDDEFMRHTMWRNFHDPYEWAWADGRGRWDLLDVTRMVRALRPDGIIWPTKRTTDRATGKMHEVPTVNLVDMAKSNGFENQNAHDALADVDALINLARLLRDKQPRMWEYLYSIRDRKSVAGVVKPNNPVPFIYTSGRYSSSNEKTTAAVIIGNGVSQTSHVVWDLRYSVNDFNDMTDDDIKGNLFAKHEVRQDPNFVALPVKEIGLNKCPAVAPLGTLDEASQQRINLPLQQVTDNLRSVRDNHDFLSRLVAIWQHRRDNFVKSHDVEDQLYDGFTPQSDRTLIRLVAVANETDLADMHPQFTDERLTELLLRYKARQYPRSLSEAEQQQWEKYRTQKLARELPGYLQTLGALAQHGADDFLLQEMQLWAESIVPAE